MTITHVDDDVIAGRVVEGRSNWLLIRNLIRLIVHYLNDFAALCREDVGSIVGVLIELRAIATMPTALTAT